MSDYEAWCHQIQLGRILNQAIAVERLEVIVAAVGDVEDFWAAALEDAEEIAEVCDERR